MRPSPQPRFKRVDRGHNRDLALVPGWATDHRIFDCLDVPYNYILVTDFSPLGWQDDLLTYLRQEQVRSITILGYSLGGYQALELARRHQNIFSEIILVSVQEQYSQVELERVRKLLAENRETYMRSFYRACFSAADYDSWNWFKRHLLNDYLRKTDSETLVRGLDYLAHARIEPSALAQLPAARVIHGRLDNISPFSNQGQWPVTVHILEQTGHLPFIHPDFGGIFHR